jgi:uncharacterized repeat protein (TIGR01451 family)
MSAAPNPVAPGSALTYTVIVRNSGAFPTDANKMRDPLPPGTSPAAAGQGCQFKDGAVICSVPHLKPGDSAFFSYSVRVAVGASGVITNTAYADWDDRVREGNESNNTATVQTTISP